MPSPTEAATLSTLVGRTVLSAATNVLGQVRKPAVAINQLRYVLEANGLAEMAFNDDVHVRSGRLYIKDKTAASNLAELLQQLKVTSDLDALSTRHFVIHRFQMAAGSPSSMAT
jgi:hypothetical protein